MEDIIKKYGTGALISGDQLKDYANPLVRVSPKLDLILGGGIPGGSVVTLAGAPKGGKTVTALHIGGKGQLAGRKLFYLSVEGRIKPRDINGIKCLNTKDMRIIRSHRQEGADAHIFTAEEFLQVAENICHNEPHSIIIVDSISQLATSGELDKDIGEMSRAPGAMLLAQFTKKMSNVIPVNDIILVGILHFIANTSGYGKTFVASGGNKIKYACDIGLEIKKFSFMREGSKDDEESAGKAYGQKVEWITTSTAFAPPGQSTTSVIRYGVGIDETAELVQLGVEFGFIKKGGSWYSLDYMREKVVNPEDFDKKNYKVQGEKNLTDFIENNKEERDILQKCLEEITQ